uniref:Anaphase-promoting complex subunit 4 n=1 Tax=Anopheles farauti TaxID=69004 RepID=A0A182QH64_9DIPT
MATQNLGGRNLMKQTCNKNIGSRVDMLRWNEEMDLLAIATEKGEVMLQRLKWQKVWQLGPPQEGLKTCHEEYLHDLPELSSLSSSAKPINTNRSEFCTKHILNILLIGTTDGRVHLSALGILSCGSVDVFATLGFTASASPSARICEAQISLDFKQLIVGVHRNGVLNVVILENELLYKYAPSVLNLALKKSHIHATMSYVNDTIDCIMEAWETVLLEMDNKLTHYAKDQPDGSISADFLELLMFGTASPSLEQFLLRDLTEKGLRKLAYSIELSYFTIQRLVLNPLYAAIQAMFFHLNALDGMLRNRFYYGELMRETATVVLRSCGAFQIKAHELAQTIDESKRDFKIFFRWLYVVIVRVMDETLQENHPMITQREIHYLAMFLSNFDASQNNTRNEEVSAIVSRRKFNLERVGQYLEDKPLVRPMPHDDENQWKKLLEENQCLRESLAIYPHNEDMSLLQQQKQLKEKIVELFAQPGPVIGANFKLKHSLTIQTPAPSAGIETDVRTFAFNCHSADQLMLLAILHSSSSLLLVECFHDGGFKAVRVHLEEKPYFDQRFEGIGTLSFQHLAFYNEDTLSLLMHAQNPDEGGRTTCCYFVQLNLVPVRKLLASVEPRESMQTLTEDAAGCQAINAYTLIDDSSLKPLESSDAYRIAVSGKLNVVAVLSESLKNVRVYDLDGPEDDDMLETSSQINSSLENSQEDV